MKFPPALALAVALGAGCVLGFAFARRGAANIADARREELRAVSPAAAIPAPTPRGLMNAMALRERFGEIQQEPLRSRRLVALDRWCAELDLDGIRGAVQLAPRDGAPANYEIRARLMGRWAQLDPAGAAQWAIESRDDHFRGSLGTVLSVWVAHDADAAERFAASVSDTSTFNGFIDSFATSLGRIDPERALAFHEKVSGARQESVMWPAFRALAARNPAAAAARAMTMPEGRLRERAIESMMRTWVNTDAQAAMAWVTRVPDDRGLLRTAVNAWSEADPAAAAHFVQSLPASGQRDTMLVNVACAWTMHERDAGLRWVQSLPDETARAEALSSIVRNWAFLEPAGAVEFIARQPRDDRTAEALKTAAQSWAGSDPESALAWAAAQTDTALRAAIIPAALSQLAADDPAAATAQLAALHEPALRKKAIEQIAESWARHAPQAAARWLLELPGGEGSDKALADAVATGTHRDPAAMAHWIESLPGDSRRDAIVAAFARSASAHDPPAALEWAATLSDAGKRRGLVKELVGGFANYDAAAARDWVLGGKLDNAEQKTLLEQIEQATKRR